MSGITSESHIWTPEKGLQSGGYISEGVISPPRQVKTAQDHVYDVVVIGAGYAGLIAARDLVNAGRSVLVVEGRDRVGGRTYTIKHEGFNYEMGGTWVHHTQPYTYRELMRYDLHTKLIKTRDDTQANNYFSINVPGSKRDISNELSSEIIGKVWRLFVDIDGQEGRTVCPLPHAQLENPFINRKDVEKWDSISCWDRFEAIKGQLNTEEQGVLKALLLSITGGKPDLKNSGFWDMIRSHAINGHTYDMMDPIWLLYKLRDGQSHFARLMFEEAVELGLEYTFRTHIEAIKQVNEGPTLVRARDGRVFRGRKIICTAPLNTLNSIQFDPPLSRLRQEAANQGHINFMTKAHAVVKGSGYASWNGLAYPNELSAAYGDGLLPNGDTHLVSFGADYRDEFVLEEQPERLVAAFKKFAPFDVKSVVFHNWNTDPYTQGGPNFMPPNFTTKYMDALQRRQGNIFFANADWANAWRNFIDGALEQGALNAHHVIAELRKEDKEAQPSRASL
ncbi:hypothetical protein V2G26_018690 [Clonostachys chloroleuca]